MDDKKPPANPVSPPVHSVPSVSPPTPKVPVTHHSPNKDTKKVDFGERVIEWTAESIHIGNLLTEKREAIIGIFKQYGMDSLSQAKAWDDLMNLLVLERTGE